MGDSQVIRIVNFRLYREFRNNRKKLVSSIFLKDSIGEGERLKEGTGVYPTLLSGRQGVSPLQT